MLYLAKYFAVEIDAFAILSNHFHIVLYFDPKRCCAWSDEEVAERWTRAFPPKDQGEDFEALHLSCRQDLLENKTLLEDRRKKLGSLSTFMKHLKQPISYRANREDNCQGHFFEKRFYSGALLSEKALLACMAYVDLNPIRAKIAKSLKQCVNTSIASRLKAIENSFEKLTEAVKPLVSGLNQGTRRFSLTLKEYIQYLKERISIETNSDHQPSKNQEHLWFNQVAAFRKKQKAYGSLEAVTRWSQTRGFRRPGHALPG